MTRRTATGVGSGCLAPQSDRIVRWQTLNKSGDALKEADQLERFIFDKNASNETVIRHSLRLKAYRDAQQLSEYLNLLQQKRGWSREQMRRFVNQYVD